MDSIEMGLNLYISYRKEFEVKEKEWHEHIRRQADECLANVDNPDLAERIQKLKLKIELYQESVTMVSDAYLKICNNLIDSCTSLAINTEDGWGLRTTSLISTVTTKIANYDQVIVTGGTMHFDAEPDFPFIHFIKLFHDAIKDIPRVILYPKVAPEQISLAEEIRSIKPNADLEELDRNRQERLFIHKVHSFSNHCF